MITSATTSAIQGPGVASAGRASRSSSRNKASGAASTTTKYFAHSARPGGSPESERVVLGTTRQGGGEGVAGARPQRQLDHVVIELGGGEMEVVHAVENEDGDERADGSDQRARGQPIRRKGRHH